MRFTSLASSSHGNAYIVSDKDTRILLECGLSRKKLQQLTGFKLTAFDACIVSHEHKDHSRCAADLVAAGLPAYMSRGTAEALELEAVTAIRHGEQFTVGSIDIVPFATFHDAAEPLGFLFKSRIDGDVLAFATDTVNLAYQFPGINLLALEANYDREILERSEKLPDKVRHRITNSHFEIDALCRYLRTLDLSQCREIYLLHLSDAMSSEGKFLNRVRRCAPMGVRVAACPREQVISGPKDAKTR